MWLRYQRSVRSSPAQRLISAIKAQNFSLFSPDYAIHQRQLPAFVGIGAMQFDNNGQSSTGTYSRLTDTRIIRGYNVTMLLLQNLNTNRGGALRTSMRRHGLHVRHHRTDVQDHLVCKGSIPSGTGSCAPTGCRTIQPSSVVPPKQAAPWQIRITGWVFRLRPISRLGHLKDADVYHQGWFRRV